MFVFIIISCRAKIKKPVVMMDPTGKTRVLNFIINERLVYSIALVKLMNKNPTTRILIKMLYLCIAS